jgi:hypothetical protein
VDVKNRLQIFNTKLINEFASYIEDDVDTALALDLMI